VKKLLLSVSIVIVLALLIPACSKTAPAEPQAEPTSVNTPTIGEAVDNMGITFVMGGCQPWTAVTNQSYSGGDSLKSGVVVDGCASSITASFEGPGKLEYYVKTSTDSGDLLRFYMDGSEYFSYSGETDWYKETLYFSSGSSDVSWEYVKNTDGITAGSDAVWLDNITYVKTTPVTVDYFSDGDMVSLFGTAWESLTSTGSTISDFGLSSREFSGFVLAITGTVQAVGTGSVYKGQLGVKVNLSESGSVDLRFQTLSYAANSVKTLTGSDALKICFKVVNTTGEYLFASFTAPSAWINAGFGFNAMQEGGAYTKDEVLDDAKTLEIYLQLESSVENNTAPVELYLDSISTY
jgi:hypothetical protein